MSAWSLLLRANLKVKTVLYVKQKHWLNIKQNIVKQMSYFKNAGEIASHFVNKSALWRQQ